MSLTRYVPNWLRKPAYATLALGSLQLIFPEALNSDAYAQSSYTEIRVVNQRIIFARGSDGRRIIGTGEVGKGNRYVAVEPALNGYNNEIREIIRIQQQKPRSRLPFEIRRR